MDVENRLDRDKQLAVGVLGGERQSERPAPARFTGLKVALFGAGASALIVCGIAINREASLMQDSEAVQLGRITVERDTDVIAAYGRPLTVGMPDGDIAMTGPDGAAKLQFSVRGSKARGRVFVEARHTLGRWEIEHVVVNSDNGSRIQIR